MIDNEMKKNEEIEIDLGRVLRAVMSRAWLVAVVAVLCAVSSSLVTNMRQCSM